jgi:hypothetical protein
MFSIKEEKIYDTKEYDNFPTTWRSNFLEIFVPSDGKIDFILNCQENITWGNSLLQQSFIYSSIVVIT